MKSIFFIRLLKSALFVFFILTVVNEQSVAAPLRINEVLASSHASRPDPDYSQISDWIEIYNDDNSSIQLDNFYLSDDVSAPKKWRFPTGTVVEAKNYLLVWADDMNTVGRGLHSNFKLDNSGERIGLFDAHGAIIDTLTFGRQVRDVSLGRSAEQPDTWLYFEQPTPGQANAASGFSSAAQSPSIAIDAASGFYRNAVRVTLAAPGATIRYTTDGSTPTRASAAYNSTLTLSATTVLKARAFVPDALPGPIAIRTFFIDEFPSLPVVSLTADPDFLWDQDIGIYVNENIAARKEWERPGSIEFFNTTGQLEFGREATIRLFGRTAIYIPQKSLSIFFSDRLTYQLFPDAPLNHFDSFLLRSSSDDWHLTMFRDAFIQELVRRNMSIDTQAYRPAVLFINGTYWGIHNMREKYNESYIATHHNVNADSIDMLYIDERTNDLTVLAGDRQHYDAMIAFSESADLSMPANYDILAGMVDIDNLIDYVIVESYIGNRSWAHNIRAWRPRTDNGKWQWLLFDLDRGFRYENENTAADMVNRFPPFGRLLDNANFRNTFIQRFLHYMNGPLNPEHAVQLLDHLQANIASEMPSHIDRWQEQCGNGVCGISSMERWQDAVDHMRSVVLRRPEIISTQLMTLFDLNAPVRLHVQVQEPGFGSVMLNGNATIMDSFSGQFFRNTSVRLEAKAGDGFQFLGWRQNTANTGMLLRRGSIWKYYDQGQSPGDNWTSTDFNDSAWLSGPAELGYGDGDENTVVDYGPDPNNKYTTTYFRSTFFVQDVSAIKNLILRLKRDDGAVVYINGLEVARSNMPAGKIEYSTRASSSTSGDDEDTFYDFLTTRDVLISGQNQLAVEVHQYSGSSSDLSFDLDIEAIGESGSGELISDNPTLELELVDNLSLAAIFTSQDANKLPPNIAQNTTLVAAQSPYLAFTDITVQPNATLTLEKGVEILFAAKANFHIYGNIIANGTKEAPVVLKSINDRWGALCFDNATGASALSHVRINGASTGADAVRNKAAVSIWSSEVRLDYVRIENCGQPFYANDSDILLSNAVLDGTGAGDDIVNIQYASAVIEGCHFFGNGEIDFDDVHNGIIRNNRIDIISTNDNRDGIDIGSSNNVLIENNRIFNCPDKGISIGEGSMNTMIRRNVVVNASLGIAVKDDSYATIDHNTFVHADTGVACYEKNAAQGGGHAVVSNSIFAGRFVAESSVDAISSIQIRYSLSEKNSIEGIGNRKGMAHFVNLAENNLYLQPNSAGIDAGDPSFAPDADGTRTDMGAYFFNQGPLTTTGLVINEFMADNTKTLADNYGEFDDWIELYNSSDEPIDVAGLYMTDHANAQTWWRITDDASASTTIAPGGFLLIWADDDSLQGVLHTSFKLNAGGEHIILARAPKDFSSITVIDAVHYAAQQPDISTGRSHDGASTWRTFTTPTPGRPNKPALVGSTDPDAMPLQFVVHPNYPNPFNPITFITYELPLAAYVTIDIYNALGQQVRSLVYDHKEPGVHQVQWHGINDAGERLASGLYFFKMTAGDFSTVGKMMLLQ